MGLEDIASFRAIHGSVVLHPCDANQTAKLVARLADEDGISYIRTLRPATPVLYDPDDEFEIGGARVLRSSDEDEVAIVAAGITVHEALAAADALAEEGIAARVIDLYSIKPLDAETLRAAAEATQGRLVTVEDHWPEGGLGEAVLAAFADTDERPRVTVLAVSGMPGLGDARRAPRGGRDRCGAHRGRGPRARGRSRVARTERLRSAGPRPVEAFQRFWHTFKVRRCQPRPRTAEPLPGLAVGRFGRWPVERLSHSRHTSESEVSSSGRVLIGQFPQACRRERDRNPARDSGLASLLRARARRSRTRRAPTSRRTCSPRARATSSR